MLVFWVLLYRRVRYGYAFRRIPLTRGQYAIVDADDYERLARYRWMADKGESTFYVRRRIYLGNGKRKNILMHREILKVPKGMFVDHINHNGLDNRKANLRPATLKQNMRNRRKTRLKCYSKYKGVTMNYGKWVAMIKADGERKHLGRFTDEIEAAKAYDRAAQKYHGEFAAINFP